MGSYEDRRGSTRVAVQVPLRYRLIQGGASGSQVANVEDLSLEGLRFRSPEFIGARRRFVLDLIFPGDQVVQAVAEAAWVRERPGHDGFEVGGRFVERSGAAQQVLARQLAAFAAGPPQVLARA